MSVLLPLSSSIYPPVRPLALVSTRPDIFVQSYEYGHLSEIKPKLEPWSRKEQRMQVCAIADKMGILSVSTAREDKKGDHPESQRARSAHR